MTARREFGKVTGYAPAVAVPDGRLVVVSGIVALDNEGGIVGDGSVIEQARFIFAQIDALLGEGGGSLSDVVKLTAYLTDMGRYRDYAAVRGEVFADRPKPASATVGVAALFDPRLLVEVEALAVLRSGQ